MIKITTEKNGKTNYYDFCMVCHDTAHFTVTPYTVNGEDRTEYEMQSGDQILFDISTTPNGDPIVSIVADENNQIIIDAEKADKLTVGNYYADATLVYASGDKDTFIQIPNADGSAISNFHVVCGV